MKRTPMFGLAAGLACAAVAVAFAAPAPAPKDLAVLHVAAAAAVLEQAPVVLAINRFYKGPATLGPPGIPALFGEGGAPVVADVAAHAETQALRQSLKHPDLRIITTITQGSYRLIGRKSRGIAGLSDLKGKRVGVQAETSSAYFLHRMLQSVGLDDADVTIVGMHAAQLPEALGQGRLDAVAIWEPEATLAQQAAGADAVSFSGAGIYGITYNLNTTEGALNNPAKRAQIVRFVRALIEASAEAVKDPATAQAAVAKQTGHPPAAVAAAWPSYSYPGAMGADLLDKLVVEEAWVARLEKRPARGRAELAKLIDASVLKEARALR